MTESFIRISSEKNNSSIAVNVFYDKEGKKILSTFQNISQIVEENGEWRF